VTERERRHARAVAQSLRWADEAARNGDYDSALGWLHTIEAVRGGLEPAWEAKRAIWLAACSTQPQTNAAEPAHSVPE
jgi:hypothetical protein